VRPVSELKLDFEVVQGLGDIIDVLKTSAMIQFRSLQSRDKPNEAFFNTANDCFDMIAQKGTKHPYLFDRKMMPSAIVAITSDEGFLGEMNTLLINASVDMCKYKDDELIVLGERGGRYLEDMGRNFVFFPGIADDLDYSQVAKLRDYLLKGYRRRFGRIFIVFPKFISLTSQKITILHLLPHHIAAKQESPLLAAKEDLLIEPSMNRVLDGLINMWMGYELVDIFWMSKQAEFAARIMHLEGSTQELSHLRQKLSFEYFKQVHSLRDKVIREISASKILLGRR
jgi:ATP synthase F1 gamma subunit